MRDPLFNENKNVNVSIKNLKNERRIPDSCMGVSFILQHNASNKSPFRCPNVLSGPFRWLKSFSVLSRPPRLSYDLSEFGYFTILSMTDHSNYAKVL